MCKKKLIFNEAGSRLFLGRFLKVIYQSNRIKTTFELVQFKHFFFQKSYRTGQTGQFYRPLTSSISHHLDLDMPLSNVSKRFLYLKNNYLIFLNYFFI